MSGAVFKQKSIDGTKQCGAEKSRQEEALTVEVASEVDGQGAPPDFIDPDPELTPEEAEQAQPITGRWRKSTRPSTRWDSII